MRFFCYILSIYIISLTAIPCIDGSFDDHGQKTELGEKEHHQHHEGDDCSPLCTCNCCATPVIQQDFFIHFDNFTLLQEYNLPEYVSAVTSDYLKNIWQPPQLG
jgi:hypothetical protein